MIAVGLGGTLAKVAAIAGKGGKLLKLAGKATVVLTAVMAMFDFFDGFHNAADVLGKADVSIVDKVASGLISVVSGLVGIVDDITGLFGFQTDLGGMAKAAMVDFYNGFVTNVFGFISDTVDQTIGAAGRVKDAAGAFIDEKLKSLESMWEAVSEFDVGEFMVGMKDAFKKKVEDMFTFVKTSIEDILVGGVASMIEVLPEFARTSGMDDLVKRRDELQRKREEQSQANFPKSYERTSEKIKEEKERKEDARATKAATAAVIQQNNTKVSNSTTIGQSRISVGNPDPVVNGMKTSW